jgi:regulatory protein
MERGRPSGRPRRQTPTPAERREKRAGIEDLPTVVDAGARFLETRSRSVSEVRTRLLRLGYQPELVEAAISRLTELRLLDDDAFARAWVESRDRARPRGEHALRRELHLKGVDRGLLDTVLADRREDAGVSVQGLGIDSGASADSAAAERLLERKLSSLLREPDLRRRKQKAYGLLARNGFPPDVCSAVTRRLVDGQPDGSRPGDDAEDEERDALSELE